MIGYGPYWYWYLFTSEEGLRILDTHTESAFTALHGDPATWIDIFGREDGLENYLLEERKQEVLPYARAEMREVFVKHMAKDGFTVPLLGYKAMLEAVHIDAKKNVLSETNMVKVPTLFIAATKDPLGLPAAIQQPVALGLLPDLTVDEIDAACRRSVKALMKWLR